MVVAASDAIASMLNLSVESLVGRRLVNCVVRQSRPAFYLTLMQLRRAGAAADVSLVLRPRKGGPLTPVSMSAAPLVDERGLIGLHWVTRRVDRP